MSFSFSKTMSNDSIKQPSLDQLLDSLGYTQWITVTSTFIIPSISLAGILLCSMSALIFFQPRFVNPVFYYYRLLCFVYIVQLAHGIAYGLLFSPRYLPRLDSYACSLYHIYYAVVSTFLFHFDEMLQMAILLDRMKLFSPFLMQHFSHTPRQVSLVLFLTCLLIDSPFEFFFKITSAKYYTGTFYFINPSDVSSTLYGQILLGFTQMFLNRFLTLVLGVALNVLSLYKYKSYLKERKREMYVYSMGSIHFKHVRQKEIRLLSRLERVKSQIEKNMFYMALSACSMSILLRIMIMFCFVSSFFCISITYTPLVGLIYYSIHTLEPIFNVCVFFTFNKMFRSIFKRKLSFRRECKVILKKQCEKQGIFWLF